MCFSLRPKLGNTGRYFHPVLMVLVVRESKRSKSSCSKPDRRRFASSSSRKTNTKTRRWPGPGSGTCNSGSGLDVTLRLVYAHVGPGQSSPPRLELECAKAHDATVATSCSPPFRSSRNMGHSLAAPRNFCRRSINHCLFVNGTNHWAAEPSQTRCSGGGQGRLRSDYLCFFRAALYQLSYLTATS